MSSEPSLQELLSPLSDPEDDLAARRLQVDREKIVSRMVEVASTPERRFGGRARLAFALGLAASFALGSWGALEFWKHGAAAGAGLEVVALRGSVTGVQDSKLSTLSVGEPVTLSPQGTLETASGAEARIKTGAGLELELLENTRVALGELGADSGPVALRLERGQVRCVIPHRPGRTFSVVTSAARVLDVGTIFSVRVQQTQAGPTTTVHVEEGEVRVLYAGGERRLTAAESWASPTEPSQVAAPVVAAPIATEPLGSAPSPGPRRDAAKRRPETLALETTLLRSGLASEQAGDLRAAAAAFQALVSRYPESPLAPDARAALARVKSRLESSQ